MSRVIALLLLVAAAVAAVPASASADEAVAETARPTPLAAYGGWSAWSRADAGGRYVLQLRSPGGGVRDAPLPSSSAVGRLPRPGRRRGGHRRVPALPRDAAATSTGSTSPPGARDAARRLLAVVRRGDAGDLALDGRLHAAGSGAATSRTRRTCARARPAAGSCTRSACRRRPGRRASGVAHPRQLGRPERRRRARRGPQDVGDQALLRHAAALVGAPAPELRRGVQPLRAGRAGRALRLDGADRHPPGQHVRAHPVGGGARRRCGPSARSAPGSRTRRTAGRCTLEARPGARTSTRCPAGSSPRRPTRSARPSHALTPELTVGYTGTPRTGAAARVLRRAHAADRRRRRAAPRRSRARRLRRPARARRPAARSASSAPASPPRPRSTARGRSRCPRCRDHRGTPRSRRRPASSTWAGRGTVG